MKTVSIIPVLISLLVLVVHSLFANDERYTEAMLKNIRAVYTAQTVPDLQQAVNSLERIAAAEKTKWEPHYYSAFGYILMANRETEAARKDLYLDQAMEAIAKARSLNETESEIESLEGFAYMIRVTVDPATRGPQFAGVAMQHFGKASAMNPENPRALVLMAQMQHGTAKFFGSPLTEACTTLNSALQKFETYKSDNPLAPRWGQEMALELKKECN